MKTISKYKIKKELWEYKILFRDKLMEEVFLEEDQMLLLHNIFLLMDVLILEYIIMILAVGVGSFNRANKIKLLQLNQILSYLVIILSKQLNSVKVNDNMKMLVEIW